MLSWTQMLHLLSLLGRDLEHTVSGTHDFDFFPSPSLSHCVLADSAKSQVYQDHGVPRHAVDKVKNLCLFL